MLKIPGLKRVQQTVAWLRSRTGDSALILAYHRIARPQLDPLGLCLFPDHFAAQLDTLRHMANVIDLETLRQGLEQGKLPKRSVVLTFDDGYQDFMSTALPLLQKQNLPATLFVVSGAMGQEFWWDRLTRIIFGPVMLPEELSLEIGSETFRWSLWDMGHWRQKQTARYWLMKELGARLEWQVEQRPLLLTQLQAWAETYEPLPPAEALALTSDELQTIAANPLITIGAHTVNHPRLSQLPSTAQREEIRQSKTSLEALLQQPVTFFSYPHGDSALLAQQFVAEAGFHLACTSGNSPVHGKQNLVNLPRFWASDWDGQTFAQWLKRWLRD